jgi:uncharacterized Fe-S cluster protein YjdI
MNEKEVIKEYTNGKLSVFWKPSKCIHAGECTKALPKVYNPKERPWVKPENASVDELMKQIDLCPSGALTYFYDDMDGEESTEVKAKILKNGPLLVYGTFELTNKDGVVETKEKRTPFCRCGASQNKPYCDGSHIKVGFED